MKIVIPMGGSGSRFVVAGYKDPKPLIEINGKKIIEYVLDMFDSNDDFVFICNEKHLEETNMKHILFDLVPKCKIVKIPEHKFGPVYSVKQVYEYIDDDEEVIISYCDGSQLWNREDFVKSIRENNLDGCIFSHIGFHPHSLNNTKMAFMREKNGLVLEVKEKECYTDNHMNEHGSTGVYYFNRGFLVKKYFDLCIEQNINYNGEYYVTLVYNLLIADGLSIGCYPVSQVAILGTPDEVNNFEGWMNILIGGQIKTEEDLIMCYRYWKDYYESCNLFVGKS